MSMKTNHQLPLPEVLKQEYPLSKELQKAKLLRDQEIRRIFTGESDKFDRSGRPLFRRQRRHGLRIRQSSQKSR